MTEEEDFTLHQMQVKEEARQLNVRFAVLWTTSVALVIVIPLIAVFLHARHVQNDRIADNAAAGRLNARTIARVDDLRYELCLEGEERDAVIVQQLHTAITSVSTSLPPGAIRSQQIQVLQDGINTLEPPDEQPCVPPKGTNP